MMRVLCLVVLVTVAAARGAANDRPLDAPGFHHIHLNVTDPDAEIAFHTRHFPSTARGEMFGAPALKAGGLWLLFNRESKAAPKTPQSAFWHYGWNVADPVGTWTRYKAEGAPLLPLYAPDGASVTHSSEWYPGLLTRADLPAAVAKGIRGGSTGFGYLRGPSGQRIEFAPGAPAGVERMNHVHMYQEQPYCAEIWYRTHLNARVSPASRRGMKAGDATWKPPDVDEANCRVAPGEPSWLALEPQGTIRQPAAGVIFDDVEMNWYQRQGNAPLASSKGQAIDHVGLTVRDLGAWHAKLRAERVTIVSGPYRLGGTNALLLEGPSRERIELVEIR
jgi:catechol 2,3-dioxygenase-like lactoylglutathione lyase family enzyme